MISESTQDTNKNLAELNTAMQNSRKEVKTITNYLPALGFSSAA